MKTIKLTQGKKVIVDDSDYEWLNKSKWFYGNTGYAIKSTYINKKHGSQLLHRLIMNPPKGLEIDHINGNKLDCQKNNMRIVTRSQNSINKPLQKNNTSGHKGVSWFKRDKKWQVNIWVNRKQIPLGKFTKIEDAVKAYKKAAKKYHETYSHP